MAREWNGTITNSSQRSHKRRGTANAQLSSLVYKTDKCTVSKSPHQSCHQLGGEALWCPDRLSGARGPISASSLCAEVVYKWPDAWCHSEFKGLTVSKEVPVGATWVKVQPLLCKHIPTRSPGAPGRGTISCRAGESVMRKGGDVCTYTHTHSRAPETQFFQTWKYTHTHTKRWGEDFGD